MSCHSQIWTNAEMLEPVRASYRTGKSIAWVRVHDLPDFVYFNHSIHVNKGIGCSTCHGRVDQMPLMYEGQHAVHAVVRRMPPRSGETCAAAEQVFNPAYVTPAPDQDEIGPRLVAEYKIQSLTDCVTCHR